MRIRIIRALAAMGILVVLCGCAELGMEQNKTPWTPFDEGLPSNPIRRAAVLGLYQSFRDSNLFQIKDMESLGIRPMIPTVAFVQEHDPKALWCVCVRYSSRYKVPWTTKEEDPWEEHVSNVLVIQTQGDQYLALRPSGICPDYCM